MKHETISRYIIGQCVGLALCMGEPLSAQDNYIRTTSYLKADGTDSIISMQYYDEWGRQNQTLVGGLSTNGYYQLGATTYDNMGRPSNQYAPFPNGTQAPDFMDDFVTASTRAFNDTLAYSHTTYDALGRVLEVTTPGKTFRGHSTRKEYLVNTDENCIRWYVASMGSSSLTDNGFYPTGSLQIERTKDPDGHVVSVYTNKLGQKVLERRGNECDTYFVYDERGLVRFVLQPMFQEEENLDKFAFRYEYDGFGRNTKKILPGCDSITYEYDHADRVVKMQDGLLRTNSKCRKYEYDGLGRMTKQSIKIEDTGKPFPRQLAGYDEIVNYYDDYSYLDNMQKIDLARMTLRSWISNDHRQHCLGQQTVCIQRASNGDMLTTIYAYDERGRMVRTLDVGLDKHLTVTDRTYNYFDAVERETVGEYDLTGGVYKMRHEVSTENLFDIPHTKLLGSSVITVKDIANNVTMSDTIQNLTYDNFGRIVANNRSGTAGDMTYTYDNLHGWIKQIMSANVFEQNLYHETGGQVPCFNGSISAMEWKCGNDMKRRYDYIYDGMNRLDAAQYSSYQSGGNPSAPTMMELIPGNYRTGDYSVSYDYDKNSNLREVERQGWAYVDADGNDVYDTVDDVMIEYDGNQRRSATVYTVDATSYYGKMTFADGVEKPVEYAYDENGNLTRDDNKGLTYEYDLSGYPALVTHEDRRTPSYIDYVYAADGRKLRAIHKSCLALRGREVVATEERTDYIGNLIFRNGNLEMCRFNGGYCTFGKGGRIEDFHHYIADYQGNNRMVVNVRTNAVEQVSNYYPYGALMGDISTNPDKQDFKYSGKELDRNFGLDLYDFHARQQDPLIPGFNGQDKYAEKYYWLSPYVYCAGNPVNCVDPDGKDIWDCVVGFVVGVSTDIIPGSGHLRDSYAPNDTEDYNQGLQAADAFASMAGTIAALDGLKNTAGGVVVTAAGAAGTAVTEGLGSPITVPVAAGGVAITLEGAVETALGAVVMANASENQSQGYDRGKKDNSNTKTHGKNESHGDGGRAMTKAQKQIEDYKLKLQNATSKKEREAINRKIKNVTEDAQRKAKGENHSQGNKR